MTCHSGNTRCFLTSVVLLALPACGGGDLTLPGSTPPASDLLLVSGDQQEARPGAELRAPLVVRLVDAEGNPVPAAAVSWVVGEGSGSVSPEAPQTNADGMASARLTLGETAGVHTASAAVPGLEAVTFTASASAGDRLEFLLQPAIAFTGQRLTPPVMVAVVDESGAVVRDAKTKVEVVLAAGSGTLEGKREQETKDGIATFDDLRLNETGLGKVLRATAPEDALLSSSDSDPFAVLGWDDEDGDD